MLIVNQKLLQRIVTIKFFSWEMISNMYDLLKQILKRKPDYIILYISTNNAFRNTANALLNKILALKSYVTSKKTVR